MMTFFTVPRLCLAASWASVNRPVDSITISAPTDGQSISAGSFVLNTRKLLPSTAIESSVCVTFWWRLPRTESYFSKCARVFESVMSFTATNSIAEFPSDARTMFRPIRPKPLIPTLIGMNPPEESSHSLLNLNRLQGPVHAQEKPQQRSHHHPNNCHLQWKFTAIA